MRELVIQCNESQAEHLSEALLDSGVLSVCVEDADRDTETEKALFGEFGVEPEILAWQNNWVIALLPENMQAAVLVQELRDSGVYQESMQWQEREVPDQDWVRLTQAQFEPIAIGQRVWIVPSWHIENHQSKSDTVLIELDPGLAFGTGSHPTTHLCASWLESTIDSTLAPNSSVLDYGCGSGILAIIAKKLGSGRTVGVDIDEQAIESTIYNASNNKVEIESYLPKDLVAGTFDIVVANILSNPLKVLAPMLVARVATGGHLVLSGVLERQAQEVIAAYAPYLAMSVWQSMDGWVCLHGSKLDGNKSDWS